MDETNLQGEPEMHEAISPGIDLTDQKCMEKFVQHVFPTGLAWTPERIEINGRRGRRIICVVAKDKTRYRIHDLDSPHEAEEAEDAEEGRENRSDETTNIMY